MVNLIGRYMNISDKTRVLDLACGKGAVAVKVAQNLRVKVKGIDLMPEFIEYARQKAKEYGVDDLCEFLIGDINESAITERDYDCVILGAAGVDVLGGPSEALNKLKATIKQGGYILIEEGYVPDGGKLEDIRYNRDAYYSEQFWMALFKDKRVELLETASGHSEGDLDSVSGIAAIKARAVELCLRYPEKKALFESYVRNQQDEYADIADSLACVTWLLRKM